MGPLHYCVVGFVDADFPEQLARELADPVDRGLIRILDLDRVGRDGRVERDDDGEAIHGEAVQTSTCSHLDQRSGGLVSDTDLELLGAELEAGTATAVIVWENRCEVALARSLRAAGGTLLAQGRIQSAARTALETSASAPPAAPPAPAASCITPNALVNQFRALGRLRDHGLLSEEEFATEKARLLNQ